MKSLIIGARGLVGSALKRQIRDAVEGIPVEPRNNPSQLYIDITKYETLLSAFSRVRPDVVYLAASIAHVDKCEDSPGTDQTNIYGPRNVVGLCESFNAKLVYFSSSYVFDGEKKLPYKETDEINPINYYGLQKRIMEDAITKSECKSLIVRTVGVYGTERLKKNFAKQVISAVFAGKKVYAPLDQWMNPILSDDLARIVVRLVNEKVSGVIHVAGDTCLTKYEFALRIAKCFNLENLIESTDTESMKQKAKRPKMGCLDCSHLTSLGIPVPSFDAGLARFLSLEYNG